MKKSTWGVLGVVVSCAILLSTFASMVAMMFGAANPKSDLVASETAPTKMTAQITWLGGSTQCGLTRMEGVEIYLLDAGCLRSRSGAYGSSIASILVDGKRAYVIRRLSEDELVIRLSGS